MRLRKWAQLQASTRHVLFSVMIIFENPPLLMPSRAVEANSFTTQTPTKSLWQIIEHMIPTTSIMSLCKSVFCCQKSRQESRISAWAFTILLQWGRKQVSSPCACRWQGISTFLGDRRNQAGKQCRKVQGLYMYGGVGTGKTMLMDLLVDSAPPQFKVIYCI